MRERGFLIDSNRLFLFLVFHLFHLGLLHFFKAFLELRFSFLSINIHSSSFAVFHFAFNFASSTKNLLMSNMITIDINVEMK